MNPRRLHLPADDQQRWGIARTENNGGLLLVRFNQTAGEWVGHTDLSIKLGFAVPLNRPNEGGLPDAAENAELQAIETVICRNVSAMTLGFHALTLTTG